MIAWSSQRSRARRSPDWAGHIDAGAGTTYPARQKDGSARELSARRPVTSVSTPSTGLALVMCRAKSARH